MFQGITKYDLHKCTQLSDAHVKREDMVGVRPKKGTLVFRLAGADAFFDPPAAESKVLAAAIVTVSRARDCVVQIIEPHTHAYELHAWAWSDCWTQNLDANKYIVSHEQLAQIKGKQQELALEKTAKRKRIQEEAVARKKRFVEEKVALFQQAPSKEPYVYNLNGPLSHYWSKSGRYQNQWDALWEMWVPLSGNARHHHGELMRAVSRCCYRFHNDGDCPRDTYLESRYLYEFEKGDEEFMDDWINMFCMPDFEGDDDLVVVKWLDSLFDAAYERIERENGSRALLEQWTKFNEQTAE